MNIMGIPVVPYESYMGWYDRKQVYELTKRIPVVNSYEEQMQNIVIRKFLRYKDGSLQCQNTHTLLRVIPNEVTLHIHQLVVDNNGTIIGVNVGSDDNNKYLLIGADTVYIIESIINDFFGIEVGDNVFELVSAEKQRNDCQICRRHYDSCCSPWVKRTYIKDFGHTPDGKETLSWDIMETTGKNYNCARLIATKCIAAVPFCRPDSPQELYKQSFYEESYIKKWLNEVFIKEFFSEQERERIINISLPDIHKMEEWFPWEIDRICEPTRFAIDDGADVFNNHIHNNSCTYWLLDTGRKPGYSATVVLSNGKIYKSAYMSARNVCVRPVIDIIRKEQWNE